MLARVSSNGNMAQIELVIRANLLLVRLAVVIVYPAGRRPLDSVDSTWLVPPLPLLLLLLLLLFPFAGDPTQRRLLTKRRKEAGRLQASNAR